MRDPLVCDIHDCTNHALARVYPTHGRTDDTALRCRQHLQRDIERDWFRQWRQDIKQQEPMTHASEIAACTDCSPVNRDVAERTMEAVLIGTRDAQDVFCAEHRSGMEDALDESEEPEP